MIARAVPQNGEYIATFYVGTPPTKVFALIDTASEVSWVRCSQIYPIFNPEKSSSYSHFPCDSLSCDALGAGRRICQGNEPCSYRLEYTDGSITRGTLSHDKFAFGDTAAQLVDIGYLDFGCSNYSSSQFVGQQTGALGLNHQTMSFVSQLGIKKFSYCMVSPDNESGGVMYFGSQAVISGGQTPFLDAKDDAYYVNVTGISIGDQNVPLPDGIFDLTSDGEGGFIIDSGATYTMLRPEAFDALVKALGENIHLPQRRYRWFELCFVGSFEDLESAGPDITFNFDGAVVMLLKQTSYIEVEKGVWCLAMIRSGGKLSTLGNIQQRHYFVGFDLEEQVVSFAPVNCAIF